MSIFEKLFGSASKAAPEPIPSNTPAISRSASRALAALTSRRPSSLSDITAMLRKPAVDGAVLLNDISAVLRLHVVLPYDAAETIALFVLHAHAHAAARISPLLALVSPDVGCGKTTALSLLVQLTPHARFTSDVTPAGLYRTIDGPCTLLIDEAETTLLGNRRLCSLLNSGHQRGGACVMRADGIFDLYCPKVIALVGELPAALRDRSIVILLKRKRPDETVAPLNAAAIARLKDLSERAALWVEQQFEQLAAADPELPAGMANRSADNWRSLLAIADAAGGRWPDLARSVAARAAARTETTISPGISMLSDFRDMFRDQHTDRLATGEAISALAARDDRPWATYHRGRAITAYEIAKLLLPFGIHPTTLRFGDTTAKGYFISNFHDAFDRYL